MQLRAPRLLASLQNRMGSHAPHREQIFPSDTVFWTPHEPAFLLRDHRSLPVPKFHHAADLTPGVSGSTTDDGVACRNCQRRLSQRLKRRNSPPASSQRPGGSTRSTRNTRGASSKLEDALERDTFLRWHLCRHRSVRGEYGGFLVD
jgi:hypothetical protein